MYQDTYCIVWYSRMAFDHRPSIFTIQRQHKEYLYCTKTFTAQRQHKEYFSCTKTFTTERQYIEFFYCTKTFTTERQHKEYFYYTKTFTTHTKALKSYFTLKKHPFLYNIEKVSLLYKNVYYTKAI